MDSIRVAAFQRRPSFDNVGEIIRRLAEDLAWADDHGVQLAVFPECYLQGYAIDRPTISRRALTLDSPAVDAMLATLGPFRTTFILGLIEWRGKSFFNSAAVICGGALLGVYAKTHPNEPGFDAGTEYPVFTTAGWRFGINICNDANFAEPALRLRQQGAQILCYPLNNMLPAAVAEKWRGKSIENLQQRAIETGCWIVSSDVVGQHGDLISHGCTCIVRPDGSVARRAVEGSEEAILFDLG